MSLDNERAISLYQSIKDSNERRVYEHWHASSISDCPRAHYYKRLGIEPLRKPSAAMVIRWESGHAIEKTIRQHIENVYGKTVSNVRMTDKELDLTGEFDNMVIANNRLVEIKSVHDLAFIEREGKLSLKEKTGTAMRAGREINTWGIKDTPYLHHELQNHAYVLLLSKNNITTKNIDYVYISLSGRIVVYTTDVQQELLDNVIKRLSILNEAWNSKELPPCICNDTNHPLYDGVMSYCDYQDPNGGECCSPQLQYQQTTILDNKIKEKSNGKKDIYKTI